jgi:hypothetical protein
VESMTERTLSTGGEKTVVPNLRPGQSPDGGFRSGCPGVS